MDFMASLQTYYGADWISMLVGFAGAWMVTNKNKKGFVLLIISMLLAAFTAILAGQYGFIVANAINIIIALRGFVKWQREEKQERQLI